MPRMRTRMRTRMKGIPKKRRTSMGPSGERGSTPSGLRGPRQAQAKKRTMGRAQAKKRTRPSTPRRRRYNFTRNLGL